MDYGNELISVIVPAYGVEKYIEKCLESVVSQTYSNIEVIVVDDGSTDQTGVLADHYAQSDNRIVVYHKKNGGLSDARNYGIEKSNGRFITCIDSDDYVDPDYVDYLYRLLKKYNARVSICQHRVLHPSGAKTDYGHKGDEYIGSEKCIERIMYNDVLNTSAWAKLYDKTLFATIRYPKGMLFEDIGTTYKLIMQCDSVAIGYESKYNYILRENSIVTGQFNPKKFDLLVMTDQMAIDVEDRYAELSKAVLRRRVYARFSTLNQMESINGYEKERNEIIGFIKANSKQVICDEKAPIRDKIAIITLYLGYPVYRFLWRLQRK